MLGSTQTASREGQLRTSICVALFSLGKCVKKMYQRTSLSVEESTDFEVRRTVLQFRAVA